MKLTKYEHACLVLQEGSERLVIDPGAYSTSFQDMSAITALVITHIHPDHFDKTVVDKILAANPAVAIFTTQEVADQIKHPNVTVPEIEKSFSAGAFTLEFYGGQHAEITPQYPRAQNYGVLVNDKLYYPGDSNVVCPKPHTVLAAPTMAPWLKFSDSAAFIPQSSANLFFPVHNGFINQDGQDLYDRLFGGVAQASGKAYKFLAAGDTLDI